MRIAQGITLVLFVLLPGLALADTIGPGSGADTWTFYGYANAFVIARILESINRITSSTSFVTLTTCIALIGFFASGVVGLLGRRPERLATYMIGIVCAVYALFGLKLDVYVEDMLQIDGVPQHGFYVESVSAAVGLPAVVISEIGMWGIRTIETEFSSPSGSAPPRLSGGAMFGQSAGILRDLSQARINDPEARASIQNYVADCIIPAIHTGNIDSRELIHGDVWSAFAGGQNPVRHTKLYGHAGRDGSGVYHGIMPCDLAYDRIGDVLQDLAPALLAGVSSNSPFAFQSAVGDTVLTSAVDFLSAGHTTDATAIATQSAMIEAAQDGYRHAAIATDTDSMVLALNTEQARRAQKTGWFTASMLFQDMAGYFFAIMQAFVLGLAPIVLAALMVPNMGMKIAGGYSKVMVWLMLWWPGLAIVNYIMALYLQNQVSGPLGAGDGLTMANIGLVSVAAENMVIASGFMATLVPGIMWGLVSGSGAAFASVLDRASGSMYASQAARESASGNASMGNVSMNNTAMNAHQTSHRHSSGTEAAQSHLGIGALERTQHLSGDEVMHGGNRQTHTRTQALSAAESQAIRNEQRAGEQYRVAAESKAAELSQQMTQIANENGYMENGQINFERASQDSEMVELASQVQALDRHMEQQGLTEEQRREVSGGLGLGKLMASIGATFSRSDAESDSRGASSEAQNSRSIADKEQSSETQTDKHATGRSGTVSDRSSESDAYANSEEFAELNSAAQTWEQARSQTEEISSQLSNSEAMNLVQGMNAVEWQQYNEQITQGLNETRAELDRQRAEMDGMDLSADVDAALNLTQRNLDDQADTVEAGRAEVARQAETVIDDTGDKSQEGVGASELDIATQRDELNTAKLQSGVYAVNDFLGGGRGALTPRDMENLDLQGFEYEGQRYEPVSVTPFGDGSGGHLGLETVYATQNAEGETILGTFAQLQDPQGRVSDQADTVEAGRAEVARQAETVIDDSTWDASTFDENRHKVLGRDEPDR